MKPIEIVKEYNEIINHIENNLDKCPDNINSQLIQEADQLEDIRKRIEFIDHCMIKTAENSREDIRKAIDTFRQWMINGTVVRIIGAGRARLAGSIPANRLAHGGARVFVQDDIIPMPHSIKGGGIIAVSASGKTPSVLDAMRYVNQNCGNNIQIVGISDKNASEFKSLCNVFIGIDEEIGIINPLHALADTGEHVISGLLDAIVVAAGKSAGFDDTTWRLGHEDLGSTGPYNVKRGATAEAEAASNIARTL